MAIHHGHMEWLIEGGRKWISPGYKATIPQNVSWVGTWLGGLVSSHLARDISNIGPSANLKWWCMFDSRKYYFGKWFFFFIFDCIIKNI